jgi:hypothetical protein
MRSFRIARSSSETLTSHSGLALIGLAMKRLTGFVNDVATIPQRHGIATIDCVRSYIGLLCIGKSDFDAIENKREDVFFKTALDLDKVPSAPSLRQRFDSQADILLPMLDKASGEFLTKTKVPVTPIAVVPGFKHVALDMDVFPMNNSGSKKEGVSYTYKGHDGYAPIAAYLGNEGWCLACELREGSQHGQKEFIHVLERVIPRAQELTASPLLVRLDSGHDAAENRAWLATQGIDFLIKWNPRRQDLGAWLACAERLAAWTVPREGKRVGIFSEVVVEVFNGTQRYFRRVIRVTERRIDKKGLLLLVPEIVLEGWWISLWSLECTNQQTIDIYKDHATSEQFHSEFKTDLDIERLPSGKFATNDLVVAHAILAYNILRWIGLVGLVGELSPVRHPAKRRRLRTVMQELMYLAARMVESGRQLALKFSWACTNFPSFEAVHQKLAAD